MPMITTPGEYKAYIDVFVSDNGHLRHIASFQLGSDSSRVFAKSWLDRFAEHGEALLSKPIQAYLEALRAKGADLTIKPHLTGSERIQTLEEMEKEDPDIFKNPE
jgi:hypothetical protein